MSQPANLSQKSSVADKVGHTAGKPLESQEMQQPWLYDLGINTVISEKNEPIQEKLITLPQVISYGSEDEFC